MAENLVKAGFVTAVTGSRVTGVLVQPGAGDDPRLNRAVQIGSLVKILTHQSIAFGVIGSLNIDNPSTPPQTADRRTVEIDMFGEALLTDAAAASGKISFQRGVSIYPSLGSPIYETTSAELAQIYAKPQAACIKLGTLHQDSSLPVFAMSDELLGKHFAVLGTTGSGKSCSLAVILRSVLEAHPWGHIVVLDPHNEYSHAFGDAAEVITPENLMLPYWLLNFEELTEVLCSPEGSSTHDAEANILKEAVVEAKRNFMGEDGGQANFITVDTPYPYQLSSLAQNIQQAMGKFEKAEQSTPYLRLNARIDSLRRDKRFAFMFAGLKVSDTMADVVAKILRIPVEDRPVTIFDLSGVPSEIVDVVVSLMCRMTFDFAVWSPREESIPVLLVCEEAHRYIPQDGSGFGPTRDAISRIAKEGRKYGVSLGLVTQRPSELSETILSQCNTIFALRMSNDKDQEYVSKVLPEAAMGLLNSLPALRVQEAVVVGEGVTLPMRIRFRNLPPEQRPLSDTAVFSESWQNDQQPEWDLIYETIERWRHQVR
jgi:DNA helicase HerA-like ATPase